MESKWHKSLLFSFVKNCPKNYHFWGSCPRWIPQGREKGLLHVCHVALQSAPTCYTVEPFECPIFWLLGEKTCYTFQDLPRIYGNITGTMQHNSNKMRQELGICVMHTVANSLCTCTFRFLDLNIHKLYSYNSYNNYSVYESNHMPDAQYQLDKERVEAPGSWISLAQR